MTVPVRNALLLILSVAAILAAILLLGDTSSNPPLNNAPVASEQSQSVKAAKIVNKKWEGYNSTVMTIEGKQYNLLIADNEEKQAIGLMNVTNIEPYDGMAFLFTDTASRTFWNKNTLISLDLYWMNDGIIEGKSQLPSINDSKEVVTVTSNVPVNMVVELPQKK